MYMFDFFEDEQLSQRDGDSVFLSVIPTISDYVEIKLLERGSELRILVMSYSMRFVLESVISSLIIILRVNAVIEGMYHLNITRRFQDVIWLEIPRIHNRSLLPAYAQTSFVGISVNVLQR